MSRSWDSPSSQLLGALSDAVGALVDVDEGNECIVEFDDSLDVVVSATDDGRLLSLRSALTPAGRPLDQQILVHALALNYTRMPPGYSIALDGGTGQLMLVALVEAGGSSREKFLSTVAGFIELLPELRRRCGGSGEAMQTLPRASGASA